MLKKNFFIGLILTTNNQTTIRKCIESIYQSVDKIIVVDGGSTDETINILSSYKKIKILKKKFSYCSRSLNFGMIYINRFYKNSIVIRLDSDEIIFFKKNAKREIIKIIKKNNIAVFRKVYRGKNLISNQLSKFVARISTTSTRYTNRSMDEKLIGSEKKIYSIIIHDILGPDLRSHFIKHIKYALLESNSYKNVSSLNQRYYYNSPIFLRSLAYSFILVFTASINKNFFYNVSYQFIRGFVFRIYTDFLIAKKTIFK